MSNSPAILNQRISNLYGLIAVPSPTSSNLSDVLANGNSAGSNSIDMNSQPITDVAGLTLINDSNISVQSSTGNTNMDIFSNAIQGYSVGGNSMNLSMDDGFNFANSTAARSIYTDPANGITQWSNYIGYNAVYPQLTIGVEIPNPTTTAVIKCDSDVSTPTTLLIKSYNADDQNATISLISGDDLGTSPQILLEALDNLLGQNSSITIQGSSILFNSPSQFLSIGNLASLPTAFFNSFIKFDTSRGMLEKSLIDTTTTGQTTLFFNADVCRTRINTPSSAGRTYILPAFSASPSTSGMWYAICNKSLVNTIAVCFPTNATTIFTIPVSPAGGAGSFAKFAVDTANTAYYRCG